MPDIRPDNSEKNNKEIGGRVRKVRRTAKKNQEWLAEQLNVDPNYISMIENGRRSLTLKNAEKIVNLFPSVRIEWLLGWDDFETEDEENEYARQRSQRAGITEQEMMKRIARQAGYNLNYRELPMEEFLHGGESYILSDESGEATGLTLSEYLDFWDDFMDYAAFRLKRMVKKKRNRSQFYIDLGDNSQNEGGTGNG